MPETPDTVWSVFWSYVLCSHSSNPLPHVACDYSVTAQLNEWSLYKKMELVGWGYFLAGCVLELPEDVWEENMGKI